MASIEELKAKASSEDVMGVEVGESVEVSECPKSITPPKKKGSHTVVVTGGGTISSKALEEPEEVVIGTEVEDENDNDEFGVEVDDGPVDVIDDVLDDEEEEVDDDDESDEEDDSIEVDENGIPIAPEPEEEIQQEVFVEDKYDDEEEDESESHVVYSTSSVADDSIDDDDEDDEDTKSTSSNTSSDDDDDIDTEEIQRHFVELATERFKPISKSLDISSFTIVKEPLTNIASLEEKASRRPARAWVAFSQQTSIRMMQFSGDELDLLRTYTFESRGNGAEAAAAAHNRFRMVYDHIASPKPSTYEAWAKSTPFTDVDDYFFNIYISNFKGTNFIPVDCQNDKCRNAFLTEDIPIMDMVKFPNDEVESKFKKIYKSEPSANSKGLYVTEAIPVSKNIAIAFKEPSIYNIIEAQFIDEAFSEKYSSTIGFMPFIDSIYNIDLETKSLQPIGYKAYRNSERKTFKSRVRQFTIALKTLENDQFELLNAYVNKLSERLERPTYQTPSVECPKCKSKIEAQDTRAEDLVFSRYQLAAIVNTPLN